MLTVAAIIGLGCGGSTAPDKSYTPRIPTIWSGAVTNTYSPLVLGTIYQYSGQTPQGAETISVEVLRSKRMIMGVAATEVRDRVYLNGGLIEDTRDWYAQDGVGNVWYLGEAAQDYENGVVVSTFGSWQWGVDGAEPGIIMQSDPAAYIGEEYREEYYALQAEDWAKVIAAGQAVTVPYGSFSGCIMLEDWNALAPTKPREHKSFCPQVGQVSGVKVGTTEHTELTSRRP